MSLHMTAHLQSPQFSALSANFFIHPIATVRCDAQPPHIPPATIATLQSYSTSPTMAVHFRSSSFSTSVPPLCHPAIATRYSNASLPLSTPLILSRRRPVALTPSCSQMTTISEPSSTLTMHRTRLRLRKRYSRPASVLSPTPLFTAVTTSCCEALLFLPTSANKTLMSRTTLHLVAAHVINLCPAKNVLLL